MNRPVITLDDLTVAYDRRPAVHHVAGVFQSGSLTAVVGPNGAGKSTLIKTIAGLLQPSQGAVRRDGLSPSRDIAYLPQQAEIDRSFPITVADTVAAGAWHKIGALRAVTTDIETDIRLALTAVGLDGFARRGIGSLSAGQFQRVLFARLLLQRTPVILLDEPFTAIDARTTADLLDIVHRWHGEAKTVIAVLHDFEQIREHFPETLLMARELIGWGSTTDVLTPGNLLTARRMAERWDDDAELCRRSAS
jgi:zinc/manganese transport system ATP-binding protein